MKSKEEGEVNLVKGNETVGYWGAFAVMGSVCVQRGGGRQRQF